jgi:hypothetical protein
VPRQRLNAPGIIPTVLLQWSVFLIWIVPAVFYWVSEYLVVILLADLSGTRYNRMKLPKMNDAAQTMYKGTSISCPCHAGPRPDAL